MMSIHFHIYTDWSGASLIDKEIINTVDDYREFLLGYNGGVWGSLTIKYYGNTLVIDREDLWYLHFAIHMRAIEAILANETFRWAFHEQTPDYMTFDYADFYNIDAKTDGVRIRHWGKKTYEDDRGSIMYISTDCMLQEIIVPKQDYTIQMLNCIETFWKYRMALQKDMHPNTLASLNMFSNKISELKNKVKA